MDINKLIQENPNILIYTFAGVVVLFLAFFIISKVVSGRKVKALLAQPGMVHILFAENAMPASGVLTDTQFSGFKVYSFNGEKPKLIGKSMVVPKGECRLEVQYINTEYMSNRRSTTTVYDKQTLEFTAKEGVCYKVKYNTGPGQFELVETQK